MVRASGYLNKEVSKITGMEPQTIAYYSNIGLVLPSVDKGKGRGSNRRYSNEDIVKLLVIKELSNLKLSLEKIKIVFDQLAGLDGFLNIASSDRRAYKYKRQIICIYNAHSENLKTIPCSMFDPSGMEKYYNDNPEDGLGRKIPINKISELLKGSRDDLLSFKIDMLNNSSAIVVDITALCYVLK